jgi:hypothetical protein
MGVIRGENSGGKVWINVMGVGGNRGGDCVLQKMYYNPIFTIFVIQKQFYAKD